MLVGGSGSGKSTFLSSLLNNIDDLVREPFGRICIFYQLLSPDLTALLTTIPTLELKQGIPTQEDVDGLTGEQPTLFVIEDGLTEIRNSKLMAQLITRVSSHRSLSVCVTVQVGEDSAMCDVRSGA